MDYSPALLKAHSVPLGGEFASLQLQQSESKYMDYPELRDIVVNTKESIVQDPFQIDELDDAIMNDNNIPFEEAN